MCNGPCECFNPESWKSIKHTEIWRKDGSVATVNRRKSGFNTVFLTHDKPSDHSSRDWVFWQILFFKKWLADFIFFFSLLGAQYIYFRCHVFNMHNEFIATTCYNHMDATNTHKDVIRVHEHDKTQIKKIYLTAFVHNCASMHFLTFLNMETQRGWERLTLLTVKHCIFSGRVVSGAAPWFDSTASEM